jgi:hypothetical protein
MSGETGLFDSLIGMGEETARITLPAHLKIFLVNCLMEYLTDPSITHCVLALAFLEATEKTGVERALSLRRAGDASLILAGLYPERALRLNVSSVYFRSLGQASYASLAVHLSVTASPERGKFFHGVARDFALLEHVLHHTRSKATNEWEAFLRFRTQIF